MASRFLYGAQGLVLSDCEVEQSGKAIVQVIPTKTVQPPGALVALADHSCLPQCSEVGALCRPAHGQIKRGAGQLAAGLEGAESRDDREPNRVAQCRAHSDECQSVPGWVHQLTRLTTSHGADITATCSSLSEHVLCSEISEHPTANRRSLR